VINPYNFVKAIKNNKINFVTGVPDSLLKNLTNCISDNLKKNHIISTNEGSALALAIGHYLATKSPGIVYMQNSGLGNIINPVTSLAHPYVYGIPVILLVGWRGELLSENKQVEDEPQHKKQGQITIKQLKLLDIPIKIINKRTKNIKLILNNLKKLSIKKQTPVAIVVRKNTFTKYNQKKIKKIKQNALYREEIINEIVSLSSNKQIILSTTGMASRELFEIREKKNQKTFKDFLTVGGMGHVSQIAAGVAMNKKNKKIICIDGDGSLLMHMGSLGISSKLKNIIHILINNKSHDSVGGQPTLGEFIDFTKISKACGYKSNILIKNKKKIRSTIKKALKNKNNSFLQINCEKGYRNNLGRPDKNIKKRKDLFIKHLNY
jgi:phosphonopyruvate decarboxylase